MHEVISSVGIDIGTSTTQLVFSRLTIENPAGSYRIPKITIVEKQVIYRSKIYFTPLISATEIDAEGVKRIVRSEYAAAGMKPGDLQTGAVIITGDTARKKNANEVLSALSDLAGDFVVATAGPSLESVLAARGAGTDKLSLDNKTVIANIDIGGGTSNIAVYQRGDLRGTSCLDIGGRLIKVENGSLTYVFPKIQALAAEHGIRISVGDRADRGILYKVAELMAAELAASLHLCPITESHKKLYTNDGTPIPEEPKIIGITYSGGVADCVYGSDIQDPFRYGDIGVLLGQAIRENKLLSSLTLYKAAETIRATVVGAGAHATDISGSTICYDRSLLPIKNIPVLKIPAEDEKTLESFKDSILRQLPIFYTEGQLEQIAIAFDGHERSSFKAVQELADAIIEGAKEVIESRYPLIIVVEHDIAKVLGNALNFKMGNKKPVICIDGIPTASGDYIDIGEPVAGGQVLPVVNKTLVFNT
ncbi:MAG: ethanolamine ammonia-lyase reactivating factor EutA [Lachnospiraceae bacterium]|nr:ethanolamine ammonia-lyase reactivating factor EutA [Lachnospiraceae bacterium]